MLKFSNQPKDASKSFMERCPIILSSEGDFEQNLRFLAQNTTLMPRTFGPLALAYAALLMILLKLCNKTFRTTGSEDSSYDFIHYNTARTQRTRNKPTLRKGYAVPYLIVPSTSIFGIASLRDWRSMIAGGSLLQYAGRSWYIRLRRRQSAPLALIKSV